MIEFRDASQGPPPAGREESLALLEEFHSFPGPYMFKIIGYDSGDFAGQARQAAEGVLGPLDEDGCLRCRPSSGGRYLAVTLEAELASAEQVLEVYEALKGLEGLVALI